MDRDLEEEDWSTVLGVLRRCEPGLGLAWAWNAES